MALGRKPISFDENPLPPTTADPSNPGTPGLGFGPTLPDGTPNPNWTPPPTQPVTFGYGPGQFPGPQNGGQGFTPDVGGDGQQPQVNMDPVGGGGGLPRATGANPLDADMDVFRKLLDELNPRFRGVADELQGIAGGEDPRFDAFRQVQLGDASARNAEFFGRRGTSGSTASLNQLQRTTTGINASLGMQQLARQDTARLGSLEVLRGFRENETVPIQLQLQRMAAENAATAAEMAGQQRDPFIKLGPISVG